MNLNPGDHSDTDGDGLTDKEEIEVYGSDPLLQSTAGDLYFDGYKLEHGMDLFAYYDYTGEYTEDGEYVTYCVDGNFVSPYNECDEISFVPAIPSDLCMSVYDKKGQNGIDYYKD